MHWSWTSFATKAAAGSLLAFYLEGAVVEGALVGRVSPVLPRRIEMGHCVVYSLL